MKKFLTFAGIFFFSCPFAMSMEPLKKNLASISEATKNIGILPSEKNLNSMTFEKMLELANESAEKKNSLVVWSKDHPVMVDITSGDGDFEKLLEQIKTCPFFIGLIFQIATKPTVEQLTKLIAISDKVLALKNFGNLLTLEAVREISKLTNLKTLVLPSNQLTDAGVQLIATMNNLDTLDISGNNLTQNGAQAISTMKRLNTLDISHTNLTKEGVQAIASMTNLKALFIDNNNLTDNDVLPIAKLTKLKTLDISNNNLTIPGINMLLKLLSFETDATWEH